MRFFDLDGPFQRYGSIVFDVLVVNLIWFVLTFFTVGILSGPATAGAYGALYASVVTGEGYMFKQYFNVVKKRFFISLLFGITALLLISLSLFNIYMTMTGQFGSFWLLPVYMFILLELSFITSFAYPLIAHTNLKYVELLKTAFLLSNRHLPWAFLATVLNAVIVGLVVVVLLGAVNYFIFLFAAAGIVFSINSYLITKRCLTQYDFYEGNL